MLEGDYDFNKVADIYVDAEKRKYADKGLKKYEIIETYSPNFESVYTEMSMPFPFDNRDIVDVRIHFGNKKHPELVEKYGFDQKDNEYYVVAHKSVERSDHPPTKKLVRAQTHHCCQIIEKHPTEPNKILIRAIYLTDFKVKVPDMVRNAKYKSLGKEALKNVQETYKKFNK